MKCIALLSIICALVAYFLFTNFYAAVVFGLIGLIDAVSDEPIIQIESHSARTDYVPDDCNECPYNPENS